MNKRNDRKLFRPFDTVIIIAVLAISAAVFFISKRSEPGAFAVVSVNGKTEQILDLSEEMTYHLDTVPEVTLVVENGGVRFANAKCPDKTCEKSGILKNAGDTAACIPAKTIVTVTGQKDVDAVVY